MKEAIGGRSSLEIELEEGTVNYLLGVLSEKFGEEFTSRIFDEEELNGHILLLVNGRNVFSLPDELSTPLNDGDEVAIFPPIAGG
jgi:molybdopterin synthase sulfur carrier subunit